MTILKMALRNSTKRSLRKIYACPDSGAYRGLNEVSFYFLGILVEF